MSVLAVELVPQGIIFGADRNITITDASGTQIRQGQTTRPKVLRWPNNRAIIGYAGLAEIQGVPTDQWLYDFIGRHFEPSDNRALAEALRSELRAAIPPEVRANEPLVIHIGTYRHAGTTPTPECWFITNAVDLNYTAQPDF